MDCPKCRGAVLRRGMMKGTEVELDQCPSCGGTWFDQGELGTLLGPVAAERTEIPPTAREHERLRCPRCQHALASFCVPGTTTIVDGCRGCGGLWLDAGEGRLLRASLEPGATMTCPSCHTVQPTAATCTKCGVVVARFQGQAPRETPPPASPPEATPRGVKAALLGFIDRSLARFLR